MEQLGHSRGEYGYLAPWPFVSAQILEPSMPQTFYQMMTIFIHSSFAIHWISRFDDSIWPAIKELNSDFLVFCYLGPEAELDLNCYKNDFFMYAV